MAEKRREAKGKGQQERYTPLNAELQRRARREKKAFLSDQYKKINENNRMGKTRDLSVCKVKGKVKLLSRVRLFATPWTVTY